MTGDLWSAFDSHATSTNGRAATPAGSTDGARNGQLGLGIALVGAGIAALAGAGVLAGRRRAVAVRNAG